MSSNKSR